MGLPGYMALLENFDLYPYSLVGRPLQEYLKQKIQEYREEAEKMGVRIWRSRPCCCSLCRLGRLRRLGQIMRHP